MRYIITASLVIFLQVLLHLLVSKENIAILEYIMSHCLVAILALKIADFMIGETLKDKGDI